MKYNDYFSIEMQIGKTISEEEFQCLMAEKRIFCTKARFNTHYDAHAAIGGDIDSFSADGHNVHAGHIVTVNPNDYEEACLIAKQRGWNEEVQGVLCGVIPWDSPMINPCDTSKNIN